MAREASVRSRGFCAEGRGHPIRNQKLKPSGLEIRNLPRVEGKCYPIRNKISEIKAVRLRNQKLKRSFIKLFCNL